MLRLKGGWFEIHRRHCIVSFSKPLFPLLRIGSTQEERKSFQHDLKLLTGMLSIETHKTKILDSHNLKVVRKCRNESV